MSEITWRQIAAPNFSAANSLLTRGADLWSKAAETATTGMNNYAQALENQNTQRLMDYLYKANDPTQFQDANFQQGLTTLRESLGPNYDREKFRTAMDTRLGKLQQDSLASIAYQDKQDEIHNRALTTGYLEAMVSGDTARANEIRANMRGDTSGAYIKGMELQSKDLDMQQTRQSMRLANSADQRAWDKHDFEQEDSDREYDLRYYEKFGPKTVTGMDSNGDPIQYTVGGSGGPAYQGGLARRGGGYSGPVQAQPLDTAFGNKSAPYQGIIAQAANARGVDANIISKLAEVESGWNPNAVNKNTGAFGLMQLMPKTVKDPGYGVKPLQNRSVEEQIRFSVDYYAAMQKEFKDPILALAAYNAGPGIVKQVLADKRGYKPETVDYVKKIAGVDLNSYVPGRSGTRSGRGTQQAVAPARQTPLQQATASTVPGNVVTTDPVIAKGLAANFKIDTEAKRNRAEAHLSNMPMNRKFESLKGVDTVAQWIDNHDGKFNGMFDGNFRPRDVIAGLKTHPKWNTLTESQKVSMAESALQFIRDNRSDTVIGGSHSWNPFSRSNSFGNDLPFNQTARIFANQAFHARDSWENQIKRYKLQDQKMATTASLMEKAQK